MLKSRSLTFRLSLYILLLTGIVFAAVLSYNYMVSRKILLENVEENVVSLSSSVAGKIDTVLSSVSKIPENLAFALEDADYTEDELKDLLSRIVEKNSEIFGTCIAYEPYAFKKDSEYYAPYACRDGKEIRFSNIGSDNYQYFLWDWYQIPKNIDKPVWTEPFFNEGGGNILMSTYSVPFYKKDGGKRVFQGVVEIDLSLEWLQKIVSSIKIFETGYCFMISKNGTIVIHPAKELIMNHTFFSIAEENGNDIIMRETGRKMIRGQTGYGWGSFFGKRCNVYYSPIYNGWALGIVIPEDELLADLTRLFWTLLIITAVGFIALFTVIVLTTKNTIKPLVVLAEATGKIGNGNFNTTIPPTKYKDEIGRLSQSFELMQENLRQYVQNLETTTAAKEKIESELRIAHDIQMSIIPKIFPMYPNRKEFDLYAILKPAASVGGDIFDFFLINDKDLCIVVGDVSGKGVPAALFMAITRTLLRTKATILSHPADIVRSMNADLCMDNDMSMFVTFFIGILDVFSGKFEYSNAGHNRPYMIRKSGTMEILGSNHGMPLGVAAGSEYLSDSITMLPGDKLVLFTDGVTEAMSKSKEFYGEELFEHFLCVKKESPVREMIDEIKKELDIFTEGAEQSDDITILALEYFGA